MQAWLIEYTRGRTGNGYLVLYGGVAQRLTDMDGNTVSEQDVAYTTLDTFPAQPSWVDPDPVPEPPPPPPPPAERLISIPALWARATIQEKIALEMASLDNANAALQVRQFAAGIRVWRENSNLLPSFNLEDAENRAGIQQLEQAGILAAGRALAILDAPIQDHERPA